MIKLIHLTENINVHKYLCSPLLSDHRDGFEHYLTAHNNLPQVVLCLLTS